MKQRLSIYGVSPMVDKRLTAVCLSSKTQECRWVCEESKLLPEAYKAIRKLVEEYPQKIIAISVTGDGIEVFYQNLSQRTIDDIERRLRESAPTPEACTGRLAYATMV